MPEKGFDRLKKKIWDADMTHRGRVESALVLSLRLLHVSLEEFSKGQLTLRASSLAYTSLLSLVPLLAVSFSVLKAFGVHNMIRPFLHEFLLPLGSREPEVTQKITGFVDNINAGILGSLGLVLLIYTAISVVQKIENAFSYIWRINRPRSTLRMISDYTSLLLIGPVLLASAIGITASVLNTSVVQKIISIKLFGAAVYIASKIVPYIFVCIAFTFSYAFIPNTKIKLTSAVIGGIIGGILWETSGWAFASFTVSSTQYSAIYSGFAIVILFMIWVYYSWLVLLIGAEISFYHQHPALITLKREQPAAGTGSREMLAFQIMFLIGRSYYHNTPRWTAPALLDRLNLPLEPVQEVLDVLAEKALIVQTADEPPLYLPARDMETITQLEILEAVRGAETGGPAVAGTECDGTPPTTPIDQIFKKINSSLSTTLGNETLKSLVLSCPDPSRNHE